MYFMFFVQFAESRPEGRLCIADSYGFRSGTGGFPVFRILPRERPP